MAGDDTRINATRFAALAVLLALPHVAHADASADVAALVGKSIDALNDEPAKFDQLMHLGAVIIGDHGQINRDYTMTNKAAIVQAFGVSDQVISPRLGKVTVVVDGKKAYFQA